MNELVVLLDGQEAGRVVRKADRLRFTYADSWYDNPDAYPLSLSMPLAARSHPHKPINAFIWGLLSDNDRTLEGWARQFNVTSRSAFALIANVGEDCAGAVQFVRPQRLQALQEGRDSDVAWIDDVAVGKRLRSVLAEAGTGRSARDNGQFSLAGAQPKTALLRHDGRWGVPSGRMPTTHILKPPGAALPGNAENEHLCLSLASALGLRTAKSQVLVFDGQPAICVTRYDRFALPTDDDGAPDAELPRIVRLHQEDMCQALAVHPERKYQNEGGPGALQLLDLIRASVGGPLRVDTPLNGHMTGDMWTFIDALIFNWLIGGTDAHAKNYAFLIGSQGLVRLAPLYDITSAYGLADIQPQRMKLAMKITRHYLIGDILLRHWREWAKSAGLAENALTMRIIAMAERLPAAVEAVASRMASEGLDHPVIARLVQKLSRRATQVAKS